MTAVKWIIICSQNLQLVIVVMMMSWSYAADFKPTLAELQPAGQVSSEQNRTEIRLLVLAEVRQNIPVIQ